MPGRADARRQPAIFPPPPPQNRPRPANFYPQYENTRITGSDAINLLLRHQQPSRIAPFISGQPLSDASEESARGKPTSCRCTIRGHGDADGGCVYGLGHPRRRHLHKNGSRRVGPIYLPRHSLRARRPLYARFTAVHGREGLCLATRACVGLPWRLCHRMSPARRLDGGTAAALAREAGGGRVIAVVATGRGWYCRDLGAVSQRKQSETSMAGTGAGKRRLCRE